MEIMENMEIKNVLDTKKKLYNCDNCIYHSDKIYHYKRHLSSQKHIKAHMEIKNVHNVPEIKKYACIKCNKNFNTNSGLWKHKKKCDYKESCNNILNINDNDDINYKELVMKLLIDNQEIIKENQKR